MWLFIWDSQPSKIFVWDTQISKVFLWDTQVRPTEITETYTRTPFESPVSIYKSGYKIKQAIMEWEWKYTGRNWYITEPKINSSGALFSCVMSVWWSYGYNYGDGQGRYGWIRIKVPWTYTWIVSVNSWATTKSQNAGRVIITPESIEYHIWKTFNSWLQEWTTTPSSTISGNITTLFNSNDVSINGDCWNSSTSTFNFYRCIVTYEPI